MSHGTSQTPGHTCCCVKSARRKYDGTSSRGTKRIKKNKYDWTIWEERAPVDSYKTELVLLTTADDEYDEEDKAGSKDEVMGEEREKEKKPWKCLGGSNGFFIHKNMAENWCGSSPEWGESTVAMAQ